MTALADCVSRLDGLLRVTEIPDYDRALNGLQLENDGTVLRVAVAVDFSSDTLRGAADAGAQLLVVHHGMFWGGIQPVVSYRHQQLRFAMQHNIAVYAAHIPLDLHPTLGNNVLLANALGLQPSGTFGRYGNTEIGVSGRSDMDTADLFERVRAFAAALGGSVVLTPASPGQRTHEWAIVTGAGASSATLHEAASRGIDTLIVGEGPHHTAVEAVELGISVAYAGHYATETLGVQALGRELERAFALPWSFVHRPTGL